MGKAKRKGENEDEKMKKFLAVILSLAMVLGMSMTAFAASSGTDNIFGTAEIGQQLQ